MAYYATINVNLKNNVTFKGGSTRNTINSDEINQNNNIPKFASDYETSSKSNMKNKIIPMLVASATIANSAVGSYTGNKGRQSDIQTGIGLVALGVYAISNPTKAAIMATTYAVKRTIDITIQNKNSLEESNYRSSYRGKATTSGSRWRQ